MTAYTARSTSTNGLTQLVNLTAHGFLVGQTVIYFNNGGTPQWQLAQADSLADCAGTWMVSIVPSVDSFYVTQEGYILNPTAGYTVARQYYLSPTVSGMLTLTAPSAGQVTLPCFIADTPTSGYFYGGSGFILQSPTPFAWAVATVNQGMTINTGYIVNGAGVITLTLPATAAVGSVFEVSGQSASGWSVALNAGQTLHMGANDTSSGGSVSSTLAHDAMRFVCSVANTDFIWLSGVGNLTIV